MLNEIRRIFYSRTSEIITDIMKLHSADPDFKPTWYNGNRLNFYSILYLFISFLLTIRMATFTVVLLALESPEYFEMATTYLSVELNSGLFYRHLIRERLTGALMVPYCINCVVILAYTLLIPNKTLWNFVNDYLINNGAQFWLANPHLKISPIDLLKNPLQTAKKVANILLEMWWRTTSISEKSSRINFKVNFHKPLTYMANYSHQTRSRTLLLHLFMEIVFWFVQIISDGVYILAIAYHFRLAYSELPLYQVALASLDMVTIVWMISQCITLLFFAIVTLIVGGFMVSMHLIELNTKALDGAISTAAAAIGRKSTEKMLKTVPKVYYFLEEHHKIVQLTEMLNRTMIRNLLSVLSISAVVSTIYMISSLTFMDLTPFIRTTYFTYLGMYSWLVVMCCSPFIFTVELLHACAPRLYKLQSHVVCGRINSSSGPILRTKLKLLAAYELLHTNDKFYFTIGQFANINRNSLFEFIFFYSGYLLYSFKMYIVHKS